MSDGVTARQLEEFATQQVNSKLRNYTRAINRDLAQQNPFDLMQRNVLLTMQELYTDVQQKLLADSVENKREIDNTAMIEEIKTACDKFMDNFLPSVIKHHRSSCALSNFPQEHNPSPEYIAEVLTAAAQQWKSVKMDITKTLTMTGSKQEVPSEC